VNLVVVPTETLQVVQTQVQEELHVREANTYRKNLKLLQDTDNLQSSTKDAKYQLVQERYKASKLEKMINDVCVEFPHCNILIDTMLPQKLYIIVSKATDLEDTTTKMDAEYKALITELEAKPPRTPRIEKEARAQALKGYASIVEVRIEEAQKLINNAREEWTNMEDIDDLVKIQEQLQATQHQVDALTDTLKDLPPIQRMLKMSESTKLQAKMQKLRAKEACFTETLQPWQVRLLDIAVNITENLSHAQQI
jgi:hypothetical protein